MKYVVELQEAEDELLTELEDEQFDREVGLSDEEDTEAGGICFECLDEIRALDKPTTGQTVGNILSVLAGGALSYYGYRAGKRETQNVNNLRIAQGYDPLSSTGMSWAGAMTGLPFISNGIYGLAGGNSRFGNYACSSGYANGANMYSPFGHYGANAHGNLAGRRALGS